MKIESNIKQVKRLLLAFIICLFLSGATAIPVAQELRFLLQFISPDTVASIWGMTILKSYESVQQQHPYLLYGYDWLAFAHFVLAILFIGPYKDPVKNSWVIQFGLIACVLIIPFAFVTGYFRSIPIWWRLVDCSFGVVGFAVLWPCQVKIKTLSQHFKTAI